MATLTEENRLHDILVLETFREYSREKVTIPTGQNLALATVIGKITKSTPAGGTADGGNTGAGTCSDVTAGVKAQLGTYAIECVGEAANGGTFKVTAPNGEALPDAEVGVAYTNEQINFTLNDGDPDFADGDKFTIEVAEGSGKTPAIDFTAVDGSQDAYGFLIDGYDASAADVEGVAIVRDALITEENLVWPAGTTADQKAAAMAQLKERGILTREYA